MSSGDEYQTVRNLRAYHKAGHTVVGHVIGRCITEISITRQHSGYGGYCRFHPLIEDANDHPEWRDELGNSDLITIYYAGMVATAYYCASYGGEDDYPEESEQDDLAKADALLLQLCSDEHERETMKNASWHQTQQILSNYRLAVQALALK